MLLTSTDGASIELRPTGYQFPVVPTTPPQAGGWDANWLQVHGAVRTASGQGWEFDEPCLTTWEAQQLARWLRDSARGEVPVTLSPDGDPVGVLEFTEPHLAFSIAARKSEHLVVHVHLSHEATPPRPWPAPWEQQQPERGARVLTLALRTTAANVLAAAHTWQDDLAPYPHRPATHPR